jgi:glycosyltransferase involved in cell wall biosynthesis
MRFLFFVPLAIKRNLNIATEVAAKLRSLGHDIHLFTREMTRVNLNGNNVLSRNKSNIQESASKLGWESISCLHSKKSTREYDSERHLEKADNSIIDYFAKYFRPDAIVICDATLAESDPMIISARCILTDNPAFYIRFQQEAGQWLLRHGNKDYQLLNGTRSTINQVCVAIIKSADKYKSQNNLEDILTKEKVKIAEIESHDRARVRPSLLIKQNLASSSNKSTASVLTGEIESIADGSVILGNTLWLKGWLDFSLPRLKYLAIHLNDQMYRCFPNIIRGELIERHRNPDILGFEMHLPIASEGPRLKLTIGLVTDDGKERPWKKLFLWGDKAVPQQYRSPVALGHAEFREEGDYLHLCGLITIVGYEIRSVRAVQLGQTLSIQTVENPSHTLEFDLRFIRNKLQELISPIHLWLDLTGSEEVYWLRLHLKDVTILTQRNDLRLIEPLEGSVIHGTEIFVKIKGNTPSREITLFFNGIEVAKDITQNWAEGIVTSFRSHANNILIEATDSNGAYAFSRVWRYLEDPVSRTYQTIVSLPIEFHSSHCLTSAETHTKIKVLVIRRAPAPTDELYILAPLRKYAEQGLLHLDVVNTDTDLLDDKTFEQLLHTGTHVIASRYVTDELVEKLTKKRSTLGSIYYLMDDDVVGAEDSRWLPGGYRLRMMKVAHGEFQAMLALCDRFIVTCEFLKQRYNSPKTDLLEPPYLHPPSHLNHLRNDRDITIAYHGTMVHRDDIGAISSALRAIHDKYPNVRIQIVMGDYAPAGLKGLPRVEIVPAMPWDDYKKFIHKVRAHISLAPILETPYNLGKSIIKIMDIGALGAVGIYSKREPYTKYIESGINGFLLENDPLMWQNAMEWLIDNPKELRRMAEAGQELANNIGNIARLEKYWANALRLEEYQPDL